LGTLTSVPAAPAARQALGGHDDLNTDHVIAFSALRPRTRYEFRVISMDGAGNTAMSPIQSFTTARR
jgi:hypothetical protein